MLRIDRISIEDAAALPVEDLTRRHAQAIDALGAARKAHAVAALDAELGRTAPLSATQAALRDAEETEQNVMTALSAAKALQAEREHQAHALECKRRWKITAEHLAQRAVAAEELAAALGVAADAWKRAVAASEAAARCAPSPLNPHECLLSAALKSAIALELIRLGISLPSERWPFPDKPIRPLVDRVADANAHALRGALTAPHAQTEE